MAKDWHETFKSWAKPPTVLASYVVALLPPFQQPPA